MKQALIVDDSRLMLEILREEIKSEKINVKCFANGLDALQWLAKNPVDVVTTDINMPEMDGFEFIARMKSMLGENRPPYFVVTTERRGVSPRSQIADDAVAWVTKPFEFGSLSRNVNQTLGIRRERSSAFDAAQI